MPRERHIDLERAGATIPALLWLPEGGAPPYPLVLAGHGGGGHKTDAFIAGLRDRLLPAGVAVAAIDAVGHGDRVEAAPTPEDVVRVIALAASYDAMTADWIATLDALLATGDFQSAAVGYAGLSGGCLFGLPFIAADQRIAAAVLGACGYEGAPLLDAAPATFAPILRAAAQRYDRPAFFVLQEQDDFFPPTGGRALFADLASADRELLASPGAHTQVPVSAVDRMTDWLVARLVAG